MSRLYLVILRRQPGGSASDWVAARLRMYDMLASADVTAEVTHVLGDAKDVRAWMLRSEHTLTAPDVPYATVTIALCGPID